METGRHTPEIQDNGPSGPAPCWGASNKIQMPVLYISKHGRLNQPIPPWTIPGIQVICLPLGTTAPDVCCQASSGSESFGLHIPTEQEMWLFF